MTIKTGNKKLKVDQGKVEIIAEQDFSLIVADNLFNSQNKKIRFTVKEDDTDIEVKVGAGVHWSFEHEARRFTEKLSSIPVEIPKNIKVDETLQQKLERFLVSAMEERYGADATETFSESVDFDLDDDGELPLTRHELLDMQPDEPVRFPDESPEVITPPPPEPDPAPETP